MRLLAFVVALASVSALSRPARQAGNQYQATVDKAIAYLKKSQNEDGSWGKEPQNRGVTGIVVTGLIGVGVRPGDAPVAKGVAFIETLINKKEGHIAGNDAKAGLINYITSINVMALAAAEQGRSTSR